MPGNIFLGLGSNMGRRQDNLRQAIVYLAHRLEVVRLSSFYDTAPRDNPDQPRFLNAACLASADITPEALLALLKDIERQMGRRRGPANGPRPIDMDILLYDDKIIDTSGLIIPHPRLAQREFVLKPLCEIAPDVIHPVLGQTVRQLLRQLEGTQDVVPWRRE